MLTISNPNKFDWASMPLSDCAEGNALDSYFTLKLFNLLFEELSTNNSAILPLVEKILMPSLENFSSMEYDGLDVDIDALKNVGKQISSINMDQEDQLYKHKALQKTDNLSSTKDLREILYTREGGLELYPPDNTPKGEPSTNAATIKMLLDHINEELESRANE
jgi:DNA polymerase I-like protein with 3'-5' exonuclease and polymerase domains